MKRETEAKTAPVVRGIILMVVIGERCDVERNTKDQDGGNFLIHLTNGPLLEPVPS
jgi:hypothetical protein